MGVGLQERLAQAGHPGPEHVANSAALGTRNQATPHRLPSALTSLILPLKGLEGKLHSSHLTLKRPVIPAGILVCIVHDHSVCAVCNI